MASSSSRHGPPQHFVVDGSNIATEGRAMPSLSQLNEAVLAFMADNPGALITVVVDATFGHRIDKSEVKAFDEAVANNELVTPPAGAVGRGDAFVLQIANKANAGILSNDSFQEFHGEYPWLFDEGRLIGGKPVPHVGWVFVERLPVRGPKSRQAVKQSKSRPRVAKGSGSALADQPLPVPSVPPPGKAARAAQPPVAPAPASRPAPEPAGPEPVKGAKLASGKAPINELLPFLDFVERHPVGTSCTVVVESYASHGAYARAGDVLVYLPLRLMGDPVPRSARSAVAIGEAIAVVVAGYVPDRRSIDAALPSAVSAHPALAEAVAAAAAKPEKQPRKRAKKATEPTAKPAEPVRAEPPARPAEPGTPDETATTTGRRRRARAVAVSGPVAVDAAVAVPADAGTQPASPRRRRKQPVATVGEQVLEVPAPPKAPAEPVKRSAKRSKPAATPADQPAPAKRTKPAAPAAEPPQPLEPTPKPKPAPARARRRRGATADSGDH